MAELPTLAVHEFAVDPTVVIGTRSVRVRWRVDGAVRAELRCKGAGRSDVIALAARAGGHELKQIDRDCEVTLALWHDGAPTDGAASYTTGVGVRHVARWLVALVLCSVSALIVGVWYCSEYLFKGVEVVDRSTWLAGGVGVARLIALASTVLGAPVVLALVRMRQDDLFGLLTAGLLRRTWLATTVSLGLLLLVGAYVLGLELETRELWFRSTLSRPVYFWSPERGRGPADGSEVKLRLEVPSGLTSARVLALDEPLANHEPERAHWHDEPTLPASDIVEVSCGVELLRGAAVDGAFVRWSASETTSFAHGRSYLSVPNCSSFPSRATLVERKRDAGRTLHRLLWTFDVPPHDHAELTHASTVMTLPAGDGHYAVLGTTGSWESSARCEPHGTCEFELPAQVERRSCAQSREFVANATPPSGDGELHRSHGTVEACISGIPPGEREEPEVACGGDGSWSLRFRPDSLERESMRLQKLWVCTGELDANAMTIEHGGAEFTGKLPPRRWIPWPGLSPGAQLRITVDGETQTRTVAETAGDFVVMLQTPTLPPLRLDVTIDGVPQLRLRADGLGHVGVQQQCPVRVDPVVRIERDHVVLEALPRWMLAKATNVWSLQHGGKVIASCSIDAVRAALTCKRGAA